MSKMPKIIQGKFKILSNRKVGPHYFKMAILSPRIAKLARPGQFVHLRCQDSTKPLLRRPFSFHQLNKHNFEILYKIVGQGTNLLAKKHKGDTIDVLGPLGNGFDFKQTINSQQQITILIAGGMGVAPLFALAERLAHSLKHITDRRRIVVLLGAKTKDAILCEKDFKRLGVQVRVAIDDGARGHKGPVTDLLKKLLLSTIDYRLSTIYACGPKVMLKELVRISRRFRMPAYASLEENMACGVGACLGCAINTKTGYQRVCKDGPVFNLNQIKW